MKTNALALIVALSSLALARECPKNHIDGPAGPCSAYMPPALGASADESAKWVSDEKPPHGKNNPWESSDVHNVTIAPENPADEHHPKDCAIGCKWDGATCDCNDKVGKEPK